MFEAIYIFSKRVEYWREFISPAKKQLNLTVEQNHCFVYHLCSVTGSRSNKSDWFIITGLTALPASALSGGSLHIEHWKVNVNEAKQHHLESEGLIIEPSCAGKPQCHCVQNSWWAICWKSLESVVGEENSIKKDDSSGNYKISPSQCRQT